MGRLFSIILTGTLIASGGLLAAAEPSPTLLSFRRVVVDDKPPPSPWIKIVGDLNGDGKPNIIIGGSKGPLVWYRNPDWKKFAIAEGGYNTAAGAAVDIDGDIPHTKVAVGDLNGDGRLDILLAPAELKGGSHRIAWYEAPTDPKAGNWKQHVVEESVETVIHALAVADFDCDGGLDLVAAHMHQERSPQEVVVYFNTGGGLNWKRQVIAITGSQVRPKVGSGDSSRTTLTDAICGILAACSQRTAGRPH